MQAVDYVRMVRRLDPRITVVGIAGPGDAFANPEETLETLERLRASDSELMLCLSTNGLTAKPYLDELSRLNVSHVTITINAVDPTIGARVYRYVRYQGKILKGEIGAERLITSQLELIRELKARSITCKINCVVIPGVNDSHAVEVARAVAEQRADVLNFVPVLPCERTPFSNLLQPSSEAMAELRRQTEEIIPLMEHCSRCRADAVGLLGHDYSSSIEGLLADTRHQRGNAPNTRNFVAIASSDGVRIDLHLGETRHLQIWGLSKDGFVMVSQRQVPDSSMGQRWERLGLVFNDCRCLLTAGIGSYPKSIITHSGIDVIESKESIEQVLSHVFFGTPLQKVMTQTSIVGCAGPDGCRGDKKGCI